MGAHERILECSFLIPTVRNIDRGLHRPLCWKDFEADLRELARGSTGPEHVYALRDVESVPGDWEGIRDVSRRYTVAIPESRVSALVELLRQHLDTFDQEVFYLSIAGVVEFVGRDAGSGDSIK